MLSMKKCLSGEHQDEQKIDQKKNSFVVVSPTVIKEPEPPVIEDKKYHPRMLYEIMNKIK